MPQVCEPGAEQAVADLQAVIEKAERTIGRERGQPQRETRELDGHRVEVDAVQAAFRDRSPDADALGVADVGCVTVSTAYERSLVGVRQKPAGGHEERAAAHRRIDDAQLQDVLGRRVAHQRAERAANQVVRDRLRRVEGSGRFAHAGAGLKRDGSAFDARFVVEQRLVDGAELLDAEIAVGDALASRAIRSRPRRQRHDRPPRRVIVQIAALGERRSRRREEASVERRHLQIAGAAAGMREAGDGAQRVPEARRVRCLLGRVAQPFEAVALAVDRMPQRHERARFGEQQEQHPIHDGQRLFEAVLHRDLVTVSDQRAQHFGRRGEHAVAQRAAYAGRVPIRGGHQRVQRPRIVGPCSERRRAEDLQEDGERARIVHRQIEVDLDLAARVEPAGVHDSQVEAVEDQAPRR